MPRIHLLRPDGGPGAACYQDCMLIDVVDEREFRRMIREGFGTICLECKAELLSRKGVELR